jgi:aminoglycoside phosphotransferase (APT) family kinase protein
MERETMQDGIETFRQHRRATFYPKADTPLEDEALRSGLALEIPVSWIAEVCRSAFEEPPASVCALARQGTFHRLYLAVLADGRRVIVKVNALSERFCDYALAIEAWADGLLSAHGLPGPRVERVDISRAEFPFDYAILAEARGQALADFDYDEPRLQRVLPAVGRLLARVHRIPVAGFGLVHFEPRGTCRGVFDHWHDYVRVNLEAHLATCVQIEAITRAERARIEAMFDQLGGLLEAVEPALLHGDLGSHNIFTCDDTVTALIDWEDCLAGDPVFDLAFWATFHPDARHGPLLEGYFSEQPGPSDFEARFWLYYLRISLAKTVLRHRFGYTDRPGRAPASLRIQKAFNRLESMALEGGSRCACS